MYAEKLPPHDADAEEAVVGSLLIDGEAINRIASLVQPQDFYREPQSLVLRSMRIALPTGAKPST